MARINHVTKYKPIHKKKMDMTNAEFEDAVNVKIKNHVNMTLDETALALWLTTGKVGKPMTKMGIQKMECRVLDKLQRACRKMNFSKNDMYEIVKNFS